MLRMVQISDCHLTGNRDVPYRGRDPYAALTGLLPSIRQYEPDILLASGDLGEDASDLAYEWLAEQLMDLGVPVLAIPGNHDHADRIRQHFAASALSAPLVFDTHGWRLVLLNSAPSGQIAGSFDPGQLKLLEQSVAEAEAPVLIALHHQPVPVSSPWIDRYPLLEPEKFWACLTPYPQVRVVCWGHIHQAFERQVNGILALGAPSTVSNSLPRQAKFTDDGRGGACRWFELKEDGSVATGILPEVI